MFACFRFAIVRKMTNMVVKNEALKLLNLPKQVLYENVKSMASVGAKLVKPPITVFGIEGRYASALYSAASKKNVLKQVETEMLKIQDLIKHDKNFKELIVNPTIKRSLKAQIFRKVADVLKLSPISANLLIVMAENGRLKKLGAVIKSYEAMMSAYRGEVICEITTASQLTAEQTKKLNDVLKDFIRKDQQILIKSKVDPSILGGMIVTIGDRYIDMSLAYHVRRYSDIISSVSK